jgi:outer membrane protein assembly complex protein YaeT
LFSVLSKPASAKLFRFLALCFLIGTLGLAAHVGACMAADVGQPAGMTENAAAAPETLQVQTFTITVKGNSSILEKDLLKAAENELKMFEQRGFRKADIDDAAFQMRSKYLQSGFAFVQVDYLYEKTEEYIQVTFDVQEGPQVFVENIFFQGNRHMASDSLSGFFRETDDSLIKKQKSVFVESVIRDSINSMRDHYRGEGFADVIVKEPDLAFTADRAGVKITITIEEGPQYIISDLKLSGDLIPELTPELAKIKKDILRKPYYVRQKLFLRISLEEAYDTLGYADADIVVEAVRLEEPGRIIMLAGITSGERVVIDEVVVSGNENTKTSFIRDRVVLKPGDIYTRAKRTESFRNLYESGLFAKIRIEPQVQGDDGRRVLAVEVEELPTREYYIEPGWGSYERLRLRAGALEKNLFGSGKNGRLDGLVSTKGETFIVSYIDPWLLQTRITMNVPLSYERREEPSYTSKETALSVLLSRKFGRNLTLSTGYKFKMTQLLDVNEDTPLEKGEDDYNQGTLGLQAVWDTRDDIFFPSKGMRIAGGFDISLPALGSEVEFSRITLGWRYFIGLPREYILGLRVTTGLIIPVSDQFFIPISERFFNGGDNTVRSYKHSQLGLKDENNEAIGGLGYNVFSIELRKRIYKNFAGTLYVDAGNVSPNRSLLERGMLPYTDRSELMDDTFGDFFSDFKFGVGFGLQYVLPVGPLRFDLAYNPDPEEVWHEDSWVFHFSLGMAF